MVNYSTINAIPDMTSNTAPSGIASASSITSTAYDAFKAFSRDASQWVSASGANTGWIQYMFPIKSMIGKYIIKATGNITMNPKDWTFEGSNDGSNWTVLDTRVNQTGWISGEKRTFEFNNSSLYTYYRLNISSNNGGVSVSIDELEMFEIVYMNKVLILSSDGKVKSLEKGDYLDAIKEKMTSSTAPSGTVKSGTSTGVNTTSNAWKTFDGIVGTVSGDGWYKTFAVGDWLSYQFTEEKKITKYTLIPISTSNLHIQMPKDWTIQGSNDGSTWEILDTRSGEVFTASEHFVGKSYYIGTPKSYSTYKIVVTANNGSSSLSIGEWIMYEDSSSILNEIPSLSEKNLINYGIDKSTEIDLQSPMSSKSYILQSSTVLGSGKVFKKSIDTLVTPIKKVEVK